MGSSSLVLMGVGFCIIVGFVWWGMKDVRTSGSDDTLGVENTTNASLSTGSTEVSAHCSSARETAAITYYYGRECSHCQKVGEFIQANGIADKVCYVKKEVWHDKGNQKEMSDRAEACGLKADEVGVPFLSSEGKCYIGEDRVMDFFTEKSGLK